jgi:SAM-dependent methyltransferase
LEKRENRNMEIKRKKNQGVKNIIRFNWPKYIWASAICILMLYGFLHTGTPWSYILISISILIIIISVNSILISWYIFDYSNLYTLYWLPELNNKKVLNLHAGFDEISAILKQKNAYINLINSDFFSLDNHTEKSILRAQKTNTNQIDALKINTNSLPFENETFDFCICFFSAHEIRNESERIIFFKELKRVIKKEGVIFLTEHHRDFPNFIAYTIGVFHFFSTKNWKKIVLKSELKITKCIKTTPFITTYQLINNGNTF